MAVGAYAPRASNDKALGAVHVGSVDVVPWAHADHGEERANLTIELPPVALELNRVGWKEAQADALKLQPSKAKQPWKDLDGYEVVAFARTAYKKTPTSRPWWQDETITELGRTPAPNCDARWIMQQVISLGSKSDVKPAFQIRRSWTRDEAEPRRRGVGTRVAGGELLAATGNFGQQEAVRHRLDVVRLVDL